LENGSLYAIGPQTAVLSVCLACL